MQTTYDPKSIESRWAKSWENKGYYQPQNCQADQSVNYSITLPPPNVTGTLHMGHGFQMTLMDTLIRRERMLGKCTLWQPGTDHAGIATQMVVERELQKKGQTRHDLGRDAFIDAVWDWREQSGSTITRQIRRLGASLDWTRERFSMDEDLSHATTTAFIKMYKDGLIYRGKRLVNWDPKLNTAVSDLEVINKESKGSLWYIRYPLEDDSINLVVATTRPETLLGDSAVAVHPDDERYQALIGKHIKLPLTNRTIPIIADEHVDPEFGTGCVKVTPAHDFNDYEMGQRHNLPQITVLTFDAHINDQAPEAYRGLERFAARKQIVKDLEAEDLLEKIEPHTLQVPMGDRSGAVIEPMLTDQWFIKMESLAQPAIAALKENQFKFVPENWNKTYLQWLENIQDWCISRQLWWGHRIPVWYDKSGNMYVGENEEAVRKEHKIAGDTVLTQDEDVLDTWFTASLCPFSSLGWPNKTADLQQFYPNEVLVTGFDIIFFWVARMVMMGLYFMQEVPFKTVYIHGLIRDSRGKKMSKSKGNVLDPVDLIDGIELEPLVKKRTQHLMQPQLAQQVDKQTRKAFPNGISAYGTDALRFTFCALASTGRDINFDMGRIEGYRNFCNKIWNAARFIHMQVEGRTIDSTQVQPSVVDQWILSRLNHACEQANKHFSQYRFDLLAQTLYEFTWNEFCDWYVELAKTQLTNPKASELEKNSTAHTLVTVYETILRLLHPITPYITEEIWQSIKPLLSISGESIMTQPYPQEQEKYRCEQAEVEINLLQDVIGAIRNLRGEMNISPAKAIELYCCHADQTRVNRLTELQPHISHCAKVSAIHWNHAAQDIPTSSSACVNDIEIFVPLAGNIDKDAELARLNKEKIKLEKDIEGASKRLENPKYLERAPSDVVKKERDKVRAAQRSLQQIQEQYELIAALN
jgi:valyl-tRNA synthetase